MKKVLVSIALAIGCTTMGYSQETNKQSVFQSFIENSLTASNWTVHPYISITKDAPEEIGYGFFAIYNFNNLVGVGLGLDAHGPDLTMPSGNVSIKYVISRGKLKFAPYAIGGLAFPLGGTSEENGPSVVLFAGAGSSITYQFTDNFRAGLAYTSVYRENAGDYTGLYHIIGPVLNYSF